jgi:diketogulonate reductase-like aldo/keto reductase
MLALVLLALASQQCSVPYEHALVLSNQHKMPILGFGTAALYEPHRAIAAALNAGYRLIDTASDTGPWYKTEKIIGELLQTRRGEIFITTKVHPQDHGYDSAIESVGGSLQRLQSEYADLVLLHYAECWNDICDMEQVRGTWQQSWRALETLYERGTVRAIGVSNFFVEQLRELVKFAKYKPHVVQNYIDPFNFPHEIEQFCKNNDIILQV